MKMKTKLLILITLICLIFLVHNRSYTTLLYNCETTEGGVAPEQFKAEYILWNNSKVPKDIEMALSFGELVGGVSIRLGDIGATRGSFYAKQNIPWDENKTLTFEDDGQITLTPTGNRSGYDMQGHFYSTAYDNLDKFTGEKYDSSHCQLIKEDFIIDLKEFSLNF